MSDLKQEELEKTRLENIENDIRVLARGINSQARLLESVVNACDSVVKSYLAIVTPKPAVEEPVNAEEIKDETPT